ncbi:MAG: hypothetical protein H7Y17_04970 [Chlorobia bacterium]|nr:hypothetical protein [Fimbriimonadaceae bacterium]
MQPMPLDPVAIRNVAALYDVHYDRPIEQLCDQVKSRSYLNQEEFVIVGRWKSPRTIRKLEANGPQHIAEATKIALSSPVEEVRMGILMTLSGVGYLMASVFLHWFHEDPYPILDFRALEALGIPMPKVYDHRFWMEFVRKWRTALAIANVDKRTFDRAL